MSCGYASSAFVMPSIVMPILSERDISALTDISVRWDSYADIFFMTEAVRPGIDTALIEDAEPSKVVPDATTAVFAARSFDMSPAVVCYLWGGVTPENAVVVLVAFEVTFERLQDSRL